MPKPWALFLEQVLERTKLTKHVMIALPRSIAWWQTHKQEDVLAMDALDDDLVDDTCQHRRKVRIANSARPGPLNNTPCLFAPLHQHAKGQLCAQKVKRAPARAQHIANHDDASSVAPASHATAQLLREV